MTVFTERGVKTKNAGFQQEQNERAHCIQSQGERKPSSRITLAVSFQRLCSKAFPLPARLPPRSVLVWPRILTAAHHPSRTSHCHAFVHPPGQQASEGLRVALSGRCDEERLLTHRRMCGPGPPGRMRSVCLPTGGCAARGLLGPHCPLTQKLHFWNPPLRNPCPCFP